MSSPQPNKSPDNRIGLVIPIYNRPEYLKRTLDSLKKTENDGLQIDILLIDDASTDTGIKKLLLGGTFGIHNATVTTLIAKTNKGVCATLKLGFDTLINRGNNFLMNLDSDAVVTNLFFHQIRKLHLEHPSDIITGFDCRTRNANGTERHKILSESTRYTVKESVGGINMAFTAGCYEILISGILHRCARHGGNWDHEVCKAAKLQERKVICHYPSIVQHIGIQSSMGHGSTEEPDTAQNFKQLHLPQVMLIGADCVDSTRLQMAGDLTTNDIEFGKVRLLGRDTQLPKESGLNYIEKITDPIESIQEYSQFMIKELIEHVPPHFSHVLVIQHDGYVWNYSAWRPEWLEYDYIGAPWWYTDGYNVGNGGFSLRSRRLLMILANDPNIKKTHPEDHVIGRTYRKYLEERYDIKFAPESVAERFSIEGHRGDRFYSGQFGFHSRVVEKPEQNTFKIHTPKQTYVISQPFGIGDILFLMPLIAKFKSEGNHIKWPVVPEYLPIAKHFPGIEFLNANTCGYDLNIRNEYTAADGAKVLPLRFAENVLGLPYTQVMKAKYILYGENWREWMNLEWNRDEKAERALYEMMIPEEARKTGYNLINRRFRTDQSGIANIKVDNGRPNIEMGNVDGFTLLDWGLIIENAAEIHTVHTSICYMIDAMDTTVHIHQYLRKPDEKDFKLTDYLWRKENWSFHF